MGQHRVPRGEESTYIGNGGKRTFPYTGEHRKDDGKQPGYALGNKERRAKVTKVIKDSVYDPTLRVQE